MKFVAVFKAYILIYGAASAITFLSLPLACCVAYLRAVCSVWRIGGHYVVLFTMLLW